MQPMAVLKTSRLPPPIFRETYIYPATTTSTVRIRNHYSLHGTGEVFLILFLITSFLIFLF